MLIYIVIGFVVYVLYTLSKNKSLIYDIQSTIIGLAILIAAFFACSVLGAPWYCYVIVLIAVSTLSDKMEKGNYEKKRDMQIRLTMEEHNKITKRFLISGCPILFYIDYLFYEYNRKYTKLEPLNDVELNYYLSFPKLCIVNSSDSLTLNGVNAIAENQSPFFKGRTTNFLDIRKKLGYEFYIKEYGVDPYDYFSYTPTKDVYSLNASVRYGKDVIENKAKEIYRKCEDLLNDDIKKLLNDLNNKELTIKELKGLINDFSNKAREEYYKTHEKSNIEMNDENIVYQGYNKFYDSFDRIKDLKFVNDVGEEDFEGIRKEDHYFWG